jgi:hypothetical protein
MNLLFIWGGTYGFGWGEIHNEGRLKGWALKSKLFRARNGKERSECHLGPKTLYSDPEVSESSGAFWRPLNQRL